MKILIRIAVTLMIVSVLGIAFLYGLHGQDSTWAPGFASQQQQIALLTAFESWHETRVQNIEAKLGLTAPPCPSPLAPSQCTQPPTTPTPPPTPTGCTALGVNCKIAVGAGAGPVRTCTTDGSLGASIAAAPGTGSTGVILAGPVPMGAAYAYWKIQFDNSSIPSGCLGADVLSVQ